MTEQIRTDATLAAVQAYWNSHIHDLKVAQSPVGSADFFRELDRYRFDKLRYLPKQVDFTAFRGQKVLEVGCGAAIDLVRFARAGAHMTGIDLSSVAIDLARQNLAHNGLTADVQVMNGEAMSFPDATFDAVYAHGVVQYTANAPAMLGEIHRVLKPGGQAIVMVYNRLSWMNAMSKIVNVELEHTDAPVLRKYSIREFRQLLQPFADVRIVPERFPVPTELHSGWKAGLYNGVFVRAFNALPRAWVRPYGWHLLAFCRKAVGSPESTGA